jgi:hypothetical protein
MKKAPELNTHVLPLFLSRLKFAHEQNRWRSLFQQTEIVNSPRCGSACIFEGFMGVVAPAFIE